MAGKKRGAKGKYDKDTAQRIVELIRGGNFYSVAYGAVGVAKSTFFEWIKKYPDFSNQVKKATHEAQARNVAIINQAATKQWTAAAWYLERKHPEKWAAHQNVKHSGSLGNPFAEWFNLESKQKPQDPTSKS